MILPPDEIVEHRPARCGRCATALTGTDPHPLLDQVFDLPETLRYGVHHRRHALACPCCDTRTTAAPCRPRAAGSAPN